MANFYDFSSDKIDIIIMLLDASGSMVGNERAMKDGIALFKKSFEDFPEANSISISISKFSDSLELGEFRNINNLSFSYYTGGGTALYRSIVKGYEYINTYVKDVMERTGIEPKVSFLLFSDGQDSWNNSDEYKKAKEIIDKLNLSGATTIFCAFGEAITSEFGSKMGFMSTTDIKNLKNFLGVELSQSFKEQSKSYKGLGSEFFSKAVDGQSRSYSQTTSQALEDDSWMGDI